MPFANRIIEPIRLNGKHWDKCNEHDLDTIANNSLSGVLLQLSSLARTADEIFCEVTQECHAVVNRVDRLKDRVTILVDHISKQDAKTVQVPEGNLETFSKVNQHYKTEHGYNCYLFTPAGRPDCISDLYEAAALSPIKTIRKCNSYRTDGKTGSQIFSLTPVLQDEMFTDPESLQVQSKPAQVPITERVTRKPKKVRPKSLSAIGDIDVTAQTVEIALPTPEEKLRAMSRSQPVALVPIDVSGSSFVRLCENRASQRSIGREYIVETNKSMLKKRSRRKTVSGIPGHVADEVNTDYFKVTSGVDVRTRSASRERWERPRSVALDTYAPRCDKKKYKEKRRGRSLEVLDVDDEDGKLARSCSLRRSLRSLFKGKRSKSTDLWAEGRPASPGPPVVDLGMPLTRSKSLPRSLKNLVKNTVSRFSQNRSASTEGRLDYHSDDETDSSRQSSLARKKSKPKKKEVPRSMSVHSSLPHSSTFTAGSIGISRPKSLDFRTSSLDRRRQPVPVSTPVTPSTESISSTGTSVESTVTAAGGQHVHVNIPSKPWTKPFAKVKLRGPLAKVDKDERQSSSGNWSGSSNSARQSLESEYARSVSSPERRSQQSDKDSAVSLNNYSHHDERLTIREDDTLQDDDTSTICGEGGSTPTESVVDVKENFTKLSSDEWLKALKHKKGKGISPDGTIQSTTSNSSNDSMRTLSDILGNGLTVQNVLAHDNLQAPVSNYRPKKYLGDDESSIYSVDEQGFFTSMHKDCGVMKSNVDLSEIDNETSLSQFSSNSTMNSSVDKNKLGKKGSFLSKFSSLKRDKKRKKTPPPPPPRSSAVLSKSNLQLDEFPAPDTPPLTTPTEIRKLHDLAQKIADQKQCEAERRALLEEDVKSGEIYFDTENGESEIIYARLKMKTTINSSGIPAMCSITPVQSDEEDGDMIDYSAAWRPNGTDSSSQSSSSLKSSKSAPASLEEMKSTTSINSNELHRPFFLMESIKEDSHEVLDSSKDDMVLDTSKHDSSAGDSDRSGFSTWPRSPINKGEPKALESILKTGGVHKKKSRGKVPQILNVNAGVNMFGTNTGTVDVKSAIPGVKTPEGTLDAARTFACTENNSFRGSDLPAPVVPGVASSRPVGMPMFASSVSQKPSHVYADIVVSSVGSKPVCPPAILSMARANKQTDPKTLNEGLENQTVPRTSPPGTFTGQPMPATARLIISSPLANRACFVENPHKRSLCSPVTDEDLAKYQSYNSSDKWYNTLPRKTHPPPLETTFDGPDKSDGPRSPNLNALPRSFTAFEFRANDSALNQVPDSSVNSSRSLKHSASFPVANKEKDVPSTYGRTWYDGIDANASVIVEEARPVEEERPKMLFTSFLRDQPSNNLSVPFTHRRDSTASTLSSNSSSSGKKSVSFASLHKNSMSSLATRSSDCSSSISGEQHRNSDLSVPETETVAIVPGRSMKRSTSLSESNSQPLLTFSAPPNDSKELKESIESPPVVTSSMKASEHKQKGPPKSYSNQRPRRKGQPASMLSTSFVGSEIINSEEADSHNPENKELDIVDKRSKDTIVCATPPAGNVTLSNQVNQASSRAVVSYTDSKPVKGGKGTSDSKIIISAKSVNAPKPRVVVSVDAKAVSDNPNSAAPTPPGSASSTLTRHSTPPGSNSNSLKRDKNLPGSAFSSLKRPTPSPNGKTIKKGGIVISNNTLMSTAVLQKEVIPTSQSVLSMKPQVREKTSISSDKPMVLSEGKVVVMPKKSTNNTTGVNKSGPTVPSFGPMVMKPMTTVSNGATGGTKSVITAPSSKSISTDITSGKAMDMAKTSAFSQSKSAFSFEVPKPSPPKFVLPSVRGWSPGTSKKDNMNVSGKMTNLSSKKLESESKPIQTKYQIADGSKPSGDAISPTNSTGSNLKGGQPVGDSSKDKESVVRRRRKDSNNQSNPQNRWSIADMSSDLNLVSLSSSNLNSSMASLAKSTESLASNSSLVDKNRFLKFSFLTSQEDVNSTKGDFDSRFEMHKKKLSASRTSLNSLHSNPGVRSKDISTSKTSLTIEEKNSSPIQGRFVSSLINQFQKPSLESLPSPTTTNSSGLGPSLPTSPISMQACPSSPTCRESKTNTINNNVQVKGKIPLDGTPTSCANSQSSSMFQKVQRETSIH